VTGSQTNNGIILVVDDQPDDVQLLADLLGLHGYTVETAADGNAALMAIERSEPDLVLLDVVMPGLSGLDVCRKLRADPRHSALPIVLVTSKDPETERVKGLDSGADDFLAKPINTAELLARVRSLLRVKRLFDRNEAQAKELARLNGQLEALVAAKVAEVERLSKLKRFLPPNLARRIVAGDTEDPLISHRRDVAVVYFDLRGFTAFSERAAPEDVMAVLHDLHHNIGTQTQHFAGTIERFVGDGVMVFFNDPEPIAAPCAVAARFAVAAFRAYEEDLARWRRNGFGVELSCGIAYGFATLGAVGFADRIDYTAIGSVSNLAARLCGEARGGEILISARVAAALPASFRTQSAGPFNLKGFRDPVDAYRLLGTEGEVESA
jgi:adenylate cyclase